MSAAPRESEIQVQHCEAEGWVRLRKSPLLPRTQSEAWGLGLTSGCLLLLSSRCQIVPAQNWTPGFSVIPVTLLAISVSQLLLFSAQTQGSPSLLDSDLIQSSPFPIYCAPASAMTNVLLVFCMFSYIIMSFSFLTWMS